MKLKFTCKTTCGEARRGEIATAHGVFQTPAFMPVGTAGSVKAVLPEQVLQTGSEIILGNTYHLMLRPGQELIKRAGGLHRFINWQGPILTDSGGFQVFSLSALRKITNEGVEFRSHIDGSLHKLTPVRALEIQRALGSDIAMTLDVCPPADAKKRKIIDAMQKTTAWAHETLKARIDDDNAIFSIIQGGTDFDLRKRHIEELCPLPFDGFALGGFSVGEPPPEMHKGVARLAPLMPTDKPRYLMGVGMPIDLIKCVLAGIDMFDCVVPTRNARNGQLFTFKGALQLRHAKYKDDLNPIEDDCPCPACKSYTKAYLRHLYKANEIAALTLMSLHNLTFYQRLMQKLRDAIEEGNLEIVSAELLNGLAETDEINA